jgi:hypothetical protein
MSIEPFHVVIKFGSGFVGSVQGEVMLMLEKDFRARGLPVEVFKDPMGDDIKLRRAMTPAQRAAL